MDIRTGLAVAAVAAAALAMSGEASARDQVKTAGPSTFLRCCNRMNDTIDACRVAGEVLLMDEPCSALDPIATARIEELIDELRENLVIITATHSIQQAMQQAARVSPTTAFFHLGVMAEFGDPPKIFTQPGDKRTQDHITRRFG